MMFNQEIERLIKDSPNSWVFCFKIESIDGNIVRLNDSGSDLIINELEYLALSSMEFETAIFNEINRNEIILKGFFENGGISTDFLAENAKISIYLFFKEQNILEKWLEYVCSEVIINQSSFNLILHPISINYDTLVTKSYSTSCRAIFGDDRCGVRVEEFADSKCDKSFRMCCNKYDNAVNFRGEPFIPTSGYFERYAK